MGYWGTAISSNDTYADVYGDFFDLYNKGLEPDEIYAILTRQHQETLNDVEDSHNFWFALAVAQWECKALKGDILDRIKLIVETGADLEVWKRSGASDGDLRKRKAELEKFILRISVEKPRAKARRKILIVEPVYEKGACFTFALDDSRYGGIVTLEAIKNAEFGFNLLALTRINQRQKPSLADFRRAKILVNCFASWKNKPAIIWFYASSLKAGDINGLEYVGKLDVEMDYDPEPSTSPYSFGGKIDSFLTLPDLQFEFEKGVNMPIRKISVREMTEGKKWRFW